MERFEPIFEALNASGACYVVVGGVAVNLHGHTRFTKDLDLVLDLEPVVARKALETLAGLGFRPKVPVAITDFADPILREQWATEKNMLVFQLFRDASRLTVDLFVRYPIDFDIVWMDATRVILPRAEIRLASLEHLIAMKREAGGPHVPTVQSTAVNLDSFSAAERSRLELQLRATPAERLRDLEAMWDFNEVVWANNPRVLRIAERLWAMQGR